MNASLPGPPSPGRDGGAATVVARPGVGEVGVVADPPDPAPLEGRLS